MAVWIGFIASSCERNLEQTPRRPIIVMRLNTSKELGCFSSGVQLLFFFSKKKRCQQLVCFVWKSEKKVFQETPKCAIIKASLCLSLVTKNFPLSRKMKISSPWTSPSPSSLKLQHRVSTFQSSGRLWPMRLLPRSPDPPSNRNDRMGVGMKESRFRMLSDAVWHSKLTFLVIFSCVVIWIVAQSRVAPEMEQNYTFHYSTWAEQFQWTGQSGHVMTG